MPDVPRSASSPASSSQTLEWLIVGGGLHGVHAAARLVGEAGLPSSAVQILDPGPRLLAAWRRRTAATGMTHLRSPSVHNLDVDPHALRHFAKARNRRRTTDYAPPYNRPSLELFDAHCDHVIDRYGLGAQHVRGAAGRVTPAGDVVQVETTDGAQLEARRVLLAMGSGEDLAWPSWSRALGDRVDHVFAPDFQPFPEGEGATIAVVGGGITAAQLAMRVAEAGHRPVLIARHELRTHQFDSDPGWLGPKYMSGFQRITCPDRRRRMITEARHRGSIPPGLRATLSRSVRAGHTEHHEADVASAEAAPSAVHLTLTNGEAFAVDRVLLATGFVPRCPSSALLDGLAACGDLPRAHCGHPIVDRWLRWHQRVHVSGPLAELELGPVSRNIAGARRTGDALVDWVTREDPRMTPGSRAA